MRVDANVSVRPAGSAELRTRTEIKNMNSFNFIARGSTRRSSGRSPSGSRAATFGRRRTTSTQPQGALRRAARGGGRRLPLLPRARPRARRAAGRARRAAALRSPSSRRRGFAASRRLSISTGQCARHGWARPVVGRDRFSGRRPRGNGRRGREHARRRGSRSAAVSATELSKLVEARDRIPRGAFDEAIAKLADPGFSADPYLAQESVSDTTELEPIVDRPRGEPRPGGGLSRRQGRAPRLLRRPGDEGDAGEGRPPRRQRARPREARRVALSPPSGSELTADVERPSSRPRRTAPSPAAARLLRREPVPLARLERVPCRDSDYTSLRSCEKHSYARSIPPGTPSAATRGGTPRRYRA